MSQGSFKPKIFLGQKVCSVAHRQTHTKLNTKDTLSGFQDFFFNLLSMISPIIGQHSYLKLAL